MPQATMSKEAFEKKYSLLIDRYSRKNETKTREECLDELYDVAEKVGFVHVIFRNQLRGRGL